MRIKRLLLVVLICFLLNCFFTVDTFVFASETDSVLTAKVCLNGQVVNTTRIYSDTLQVSYRLTCPDPVVDAQATLRYNNKKTQFVSWDFPIVNYVVVDNTTSFEDKALFNFTSPYKTFDFSNGGILVTANFKVVPGAKGDAVINLVIEELDTNKSLVSNGVVTNEGKSVFNSLKNVEVNAGKAPKGNRSQIITAKSYKKTDAFKKLNQTIFAKSYKKTYGSKAFKINAKSSGGTKLTYKSSSKKVATVSLSGKVTIKGCGKAKITITAASNSLYKSASKKITVTVKPGKIKYTTRDRTTKKGIRIVKVNYKPQKNCDGYDVQISFKNSFKDIKSAKLKKAKKTVMFKKVSIGTKYYLRLRAYKKIGGKKTYGRWSKTSFIA